VPLYDTLGENAVDFIVTHSEAGALFASADKLPTLAKALPKLQRGQLRAIVYWGTGAAKDAAFEEARHAPAPARTKPGRRQPIPCLRRQILTPFQDSDKSLAGARRPLADEVMAEAPGAAGRSQACSEAGITTHTWAAFLEAGAAAPAPASPPAPGDLCTIMYTSGTTGDPKARLAAARARHSVCAHVLVQTACAGARGARMHFLQHARCRS